jgi:hypothetical protein
MQNRIVEPSWSDGERHRQRALVAGRARTCRAGRCTAAAQREHVMCVRYRPFSFWLSIGRSHRAELAARTENGGVSYEGGDGYYRFSAVLVVSIIITIYASWRQIIRELGQRIYILVLHAHVRSGIHGTLDEARTEQREYVQRCGL